MKTTFTPYTASDLADATGRPTAKQGKTVDVKRLDIKAYIPTSPQHQPITDFHFWLANGEQYHILLAAPAQSIPKDKNVKTVDKAV